MLFGMNPALAEKATAAGNAEAFKMVVNFKNDEVDYNQEDFLLLEDNSIISVGKTKDDLSSLKSKF